MMKEKKLPTLKFSMLENQPTLNYQGKETIQCTLTNQGITVENNQSKTELFSYEILNEIFYPVPGKLRLPEILAHLFYRSEQLNWSQKPGIEFRSDEDGDMILFYEFDNTTIYWGGDDTICMEVNHSGYCDHFGYNYKYHVNYLMGDEHYLPVGQMKPSEDQHSLFYWTLIALFMFHDPDLNPSQS